MVEGRDRVCVCRGGTVVSFYQSVAHLNQYIWINFLLYPFYSGVVHNQQHCIFWGLVKMQIFRAHPKPTDSVYI